MDSDKCQESRKRGKEILCGVQREVDILDRVAREGKDLKERFVQVSGRRVFQAEKQPPQGKPHRWRPVWPQQWKPGVSEG